MPDIKTSPLAERWCSPAAESGSKADAGGNQVQRQTVSKVDFLKMRSNKINGLQSQNAPKTGF
jgi:hypothetical protein